MLLTSSALLLIPQRHLPCRRAGIEGGTKQTFPAALCSIAAKRPRSETEVTQQTLIYLFCIQPTKDSAQNCLQLGSRVTAAQIRLAGAEGVPAGGGGVDPPA